MTRRWSSRDLDAWADALGARTDDEAAGECVRLLNQVAGVYGRIGAMLRALETAPRGEVHAELELAAERLGLVCEGVGMALRGFANYERGGQ